MPMEMVTSSQQWPVNVLLLVAVDFEWQRRSVFLLEEGVRPPRPAPSERRVSLNEKKKH